MFAFEWPRPVLLTPQHHASYATINQTATTDKKASSPLVREDAPCIGRWMQGSGEWSGSDRSRRHGPAAG
jgi:hypothetical protein